MVLPDGSNGPHPRPVEPFFAGEVPTCARRAGDTIDYNWPARGPCECS